MPFLLSIPFSIRIIIILSIHTPSPQWPQVFQTQVTQLLKDLGRYIRQVTGEEHSFSVCLQRLAVAVQREMWLLSCAQSSLL